MHFSLPNLLNKILIKYAILVALGLPTIVNGQSGSGHFKKVAIEVDGESVLGVTGIIQDRDGFIWMSTRNGLAKYNGYETILFKNNPNDSTSLHENSVESLFCDSDGDIWLATNHGLGKYSIEEDRFYDYSKSQNAPSGFMSTMVEDKNGNIWFAGHDGFYRYDREKNTFRGFLDGSKGEINLKGELLRHLLLDKDQNLWIGTGYGPPNEGTGLIRYNIKTGQVRRFLHEPQNEKSLLDNRVSALYQDKAGRILVGTYKSGLHIFNPEDDSFLRLPNNNSEINGLQAPRGVRKIWGSDPFVNIIHQDVNGAYWIGTLGKGINYFNPETNESIFYSTESLVPSLEIPSGVWAFLEDSHGKVWLPSINASGVFMKDPYESVYKIDLENEYTSGLLKSKSSPNTLWLQAGERGLVKFNSNTQRAERYLYNENNSHGIGHYTVRALYEENEKTLWLGLGSGSPDGGADGTGGLDKMDIESGIFKHFKIQLNTDSENYSQTIYSISEDTKGYLWLAAGHGGLFKSNKTKSTFEKYDLGLERSLTTNLFISYVFADRLGNIWAADHSGDGTLYKQRFNENGFSPVLKGFKVSQLLEEGLNKLLIGTQEKGLLYYDLASETYKQFTEKEGLPSNNNIHILAGKNGDYWLTTASDIVSINPRNSLVTNLSLPRDIYRNAGIRMPNGNLYFAASGGLLSFRPNEVKPNPFPPEIMINDFLVSGRSYQKDIRQSHAPLLSHNQNNIAIEFLSLHFTEPEKKRYQYRLKPIDENWVTAGTSRMVRFANLKSGKYTFEVRGSNSDGLWSEIESFTFEIKSVWWKTWWALLLFIFLVAVLTYSFYAFVLSKKLAAAESHRLKELDSLKSKLYTNITHEFRTPLTVINGMTDTVKAKLSNAGFLEEEKSLEMIKRNSNGLLHLVNEMLDLAKIESGNMKLDLVQSDIVSFVKYLGESFHSFAEQKKISLTVYAEIDNLLMDFDPDKLSVILSNILSNALKFTPEGGKVVVHLHKEIENETSFFGIKIKDDGMGVSEADLPQIFNRFYQADDSLKKDVGGTGIGLALSKELVELMGGSIAVESQLYKGSTFSIYLPVNNDAALANEINASPKIPEILPEKASDSIPENSTLPLVLLIEDNKDVAHYLKECLTEKYTVIHAINGQEGIDRALESIPDIIISDVMMPLKDGFEVCATLKADILTVHIPIILLTAKATVKDKLMGLSYGADAYLEKPFLKVELLTRMDQLILLRKRIQSKFENKDYGKFMKKKVEDPDTKFLQQIIKIIYEDISNHGIGSSQVAFKLNLSESQLYRKLKAITGKSTAIFIRSIRLQRAKELLQTSDRSVSEVAYDVGFTNLAWFSRAFKKEFGYAPSEISD